MSMGQGIFPAPSSKSKKLKLSVGEGNFQTETSN